MKLKLVAAIFALVATPALALAQQGGPPPSGPKPTKADVQKVVQIITSDKAKTQAYCDLNKLMAAAEQKNSQAQADALVGKLGPEYSKVMGGLTQIDPNSSEGKEFISMLSGLYKLCTGPALAQPAQPAPAQPAPAQPAPNSVGPCAAITAACKQAGFVPNGAKAGAEIIVDCVRPIMVETPQQAQGAKPLPHVDPQVVAACKRRNPSFGMGAGGGQPPNKIVGHVDAPLIRE
jgi:hypothetical protein